MHTPGPWECAIVDPHIPYDFLVTCDRGKYVVATVHAHVRGQENAKDNARLIAAAPDLLNALKTLADSAEARGIPVDAARAALAKAGIEVK